MSRTEDLLTRNSYGPDVAYNGHRNIAILPSSTTSSTFSQPDPMDMTPPTSASMGPPNIGNSNSNNSPEAEDGGNHVNGHGQGEGGGGTLSAAAAASSTQGKIVQTAFIHKLYNMLEDRSIQHLISWSSSNESFVMSPSADFSKVLAQYFKHTNISSFVRQLNMYGFHKVSDVFHTGSPDSALWEFKHGNNNFKRGDLAGLREIKRRASRHALIHRDSFSTPHKPSISQPGTPAEPIPETPDQRLANIEHGFYELHTRLVRTEESNTALSSRCAALSEGIARCHQWNNDLACLVMKLAPDQDGEIFRELSGMQREIARQSELLRNADDSHESLLSGSRPYFANMVLDAAPLSPRQSAQDDRQPSSAAYAPRQSLFRPPAPPHLNISPRRFGSISGGNPTVSTAAYQRPSVSHQLPPPTQHPLASVQSPGSASSASGPNLARRHTSADIRATDGWPPQLPQIQSGLTAGGTASPYDSHSPGGWPSSPNRTPNAADQQVRDQLTSYEFGAPRRQNTSPPMKTDNIPPDRPTATATGAATEANGWNYSGGFGGPPPVTGGLQKAARMLDSAPATRRSSMASNVHSLLNPAETAERDEEDEGPAGGKRKRVV